jgi:hypothetical protein
MGKPTKKSQSVCRSKLKFTTIEAVISHIKLLNKVGILAHYKCDVCNDYHTTTLPGKNKISEKREFARQKREKINKIRKFK